ncbi:hypothetical protein [Kangiella sediminilitoris]|uniref:Uncharacterized protein n=1 Tax=Kangiella sediminilitoris TaxID=1144748 RepID=A0A1B3B8Q4_9GAMM|nr:hypothetical protein [Kangiella sediminilitoris]AOE49173.1 hypothetical protein KS2013_449 [Kangiella sediminilitoris]
MNKVLISALAAALVLGLSPVVDAKEHKGPGADRGSSYNSHSARDRGDKRGHNRRSEARHDNKLKYRDHDDRNKHSYRDRDRRRHDSHARYRDRDRHHYRDRYRDHHRPRYKHRYYKHYHPRTYPTSVYYLGQDWYYYGGYYHPYPRYHVHTRYCHHRYWEPLAVGIILGSVLGW